MRKSSRKSKVRRRRRRTLIKLICINFNFCQISARIKENKMKQENKQEKVFFLGKDLTQLEINLDKQDHPNPNDTIEINNAYYEWTSPMIL